MQNRMSQDGMFPKGASEKSVPLFSSTEKITEYPEYKALTQEEQNEVFAPTQLIGTDLIKKGMNSDPAASLPLAKSLMQSTMVWARPSDLDSLFCCVRLVGYLAAERSERMSIAQLIQLCHMVDRDEESLIESLAKSPSEALAKMKEKSTRCITAANILMLLGYVRDVNYEDGTFLFVEPRGTDGIAAFIKRLVDSSRDALVTTFFDNKSMSDMEASLSPDMLAKKQAYVKHCFPQELTPFILES